MFLKSDGILVKFPFFQGNVRKFFVSVFKNGPICRFHLGLVHLYEFILLILYKFCLLVKNSDRFIIV